MLQARRFRGVATCKPPKGLPGDTAAFDSVTPALIVTTRDLPGLGQSNNFGLLCPLPLGECTFLYVIL